MLAAGQFPAMPSLAGNINKDRALRPPQGLSSARQTRLREALTGSPRRQSAENGHVALVERLNGGSEPEVRFTVRGLIYQSLVAPSCIQVPIRTTIELSCEHIGG